MNNTDKISEYNTETTYIIGSLCWGEDDIAYEFAGGIDYNALTMSINYSVNREPSTDIYWAVFKRYPNKNNPCPIFSEEMYQHFKGRLLSDLNIRAIDNE